VNGWVLPACTDADFGAIPTVISDVPGFDGAEPATTMQLASCVVASKTQSNAAVMTPDGARFSV